MIHVLIVKGTTDIKSTLEQLMALFPRKLFNDALPPIVLKHQLYSIHSDKTQVDRELVWCLFVTQCCIFLLRHEGTSRCSPILILLLPGFQNKLREGGEVLMFQLGFDTEAFGLVFASDYKTRVIRGEDGRETQATVERFLEKVVSSCMDLSFTKEKMLKEFLFTDAEITYVIGCVLHLSA